MIAEPEQVAQMTVLDGSGETMAIRILDVSRRIMRVACNGELELGAPVKITWPHHIVLAEVVGNQEPGYRVLHIRHHLNTADLTWIARLWE